MSARNYLFPLQYESTLLLLYNSRVIIIVVSFGLGFQSYGVLLFYLSFFKKKPSQIKLT